MPFVSEAQQAWGNSPAGRAALGAAGVKEWNEATKGKSLPHKITNSKPEETRKRGLQQMISERKK